jgi:hypothetical protein
MNTKTIYCSDEHDSDSEFLAFANTKNQIYLEIYSRVDAFDSKYIVLDKKTAIRLSKDLRRQISYLTDSEGVNNG